MKGKKRVKGKIVTRVCFDVGTLVMELKEVKKEGERLDRFDRREMSGMLTESTMVIGSATRCGH